MKVKKLLAGVLAGTLVLGSLAVVSAEEITGDDSVIVKEEVSDIMEIFENTFDDNVMDSVSQAWDLNLTEYTEENPFVLTVTTTVMLDTGHYNWDCFLYILFYSDDTMAYSSHYSYEYPAKVEAANYYRYWYGENAPFGYGDGEITYSSVEYGDEDYEAKWIEAVTTGAEVTISAYVDNDIAYVTLSSLDGAATYTSAVSVDPEKPVYLTLSGTSSVLSNLIVNGEPEQFTRRWLEAAENSDTTGGTGETDESGESGEGEENTEVDIDESTNDDANNEGEGEESGEGEDNTVLDIDESTNDDANNEGEGESEDDAVSGEIAAVSAAAVSGVKTADASLLLLIVLALAGCSTIAVVAKKRA